MVGVQDEQLGDDVVGGGVMEVGGEEDDGVLEEVGIGVGGVGWVWVVVNELG